MADKRWVWVCCYDTWSWSDGVRCRGRSRKPTTKAVAEASLKRHQKVTGHARGEVRRLGKYERW